MTDMIQPSMVKSPCAHKTNCVEILLEAAIGPYYSSAGNQITGTSCISSISLGLDVQINTDDGKS